MAVRRKQGRFFIGTSNIVVPGNRQSFPEPFREKTRLHYYSTLFNSLEVNSSFYKLPLPRTFLKWTNEVFPGFTFTIKFSKQVTHNKKLIYSDADIKKFMESASFINESKGCLLVQFPASITSDYSTEVFRIIENIRICDPHEEWRIAVEFRHTSWYFREIFELLNEFNAAMVIHDIPASKITEHLTASDFVYLRFHGPKGDYRDSYSPAFLSEQARQIKLWMKGGKDVYAYFNNTIGDAFENARLLYKLVSPQTKEGLLNFAG